MKKIYKVAKARKIVVLLAVLAVVGSTSVLGAWIFGWVGISKAMVVSSADLGGVLSFSDLTLDTTGQADEKETGAILFNENGNVSANVTFEVTTTLLDGNCTDYLGDCLVFLFHNNDNVFDGDIINIPAGTNYFNMTIECVRNSCPQELDITVMVEEQ